MTDTLFNLNEFDPRLEGCTVINGDILKMNQDSFPLAGKYRVGIVDYPWPYDNPKSSSPRLGGYTYQSMVMAEIMQVSVLIHYLMAQDSLLFIWWPWPKFMEFVDVYMFYNNYNYSHVTGLPWIKITASGHPRLGPGHWWGSTSENVSLLRRGKVSPPPRIEYLGLLADEVIEHSRKPAGVHELAEMVKGPYIEFFARRPRKDWTVVGNELTGYSGRLT